MFVPPLAVAGLLAITAKQATARRKRFMGASLGEGPNNRTILNRLSVISPSNSGPPLARFRGEGALCRNKLVTK